MSLTARQLKLVSQSNTTVAEPEPLKPQTEEYYDDGWRHPAELIYSNSKYWTDKKLLYYSIANALSIYPPTADSLKEGICYVSDGKKTVAMTERYRVPLMFVFKYQWHLLRSLLQADSEERKKRWPVEKFEVLHLARLWKIFMDEAPVKSQSSYDMQSRLDDIRRWKCFTLNRVLTRYRLGCFSSDSESVKSFWRRYEEREYDKPPLDFDWRTWANEGHQGVTITEDDIQRGIDRKDLMEGLVEKNGTWYWGTPDKPVPGANSAWSLMDAAYAMFHLGGGRDKKDKHKDSPHKVAKSKSPSVSISSAPKTETSAAQHGHPVSVSSPLSVPPSSTSSPVIPPKTNKSQTPATTRPKAEGSLVIKIGPPNPVKGTAGTESSTKTGVSTLSQSNRKTSVDTSLQKASKDVKSESESRSPVILNAPPSNSSTNNVSVVIPKHSSSAPSTKTQAPTVTPSTQLQSTAASVPSVAQTAPSSTTNSSKPSAAASPNTSSSNTSANANNGGVGVSPRLARTESKNKTTSPSGSVNGSTAIEGSDLGPSADAKDTSDSGIAGVTRVASPTPISELAPATPEPSTTLPTANGSVESPAPVSTSLQGPKQQVNSQLQTQIQTQKPTVPAISTVVPPVVTKSPMTTSTLTPTPIVPSSNEVEKDKGSKSSPVLTSTPTQVVKPSPASGGTPTAMLPSAPSVSASTASTIINKQSTLTSKPPGSASGMAEAVPPGSAVSEKVSVTPQVNLPKKPSPVSSVPSAPKVAPMLASTSENTNKSSSSDTGTSAKKPSPVSSTPSTPKVVPMVASTSENTKKSSSSDTGTSAKKPSPVSSAPSTPKVVPMAASTSEDTNKSSSSDTGTSAPKPTSIKSTPPPSQPSANDPKPEGVTQTGSGAPSDPITSGTDSRKRSASEAGFGIGGKSVTETSKVTQNEASSNGSTGSLGTTSAMEVESSNQLSDDEDAIPGLTYSSSANSLNNTPTIKPALIQTSAPIQQTPPIVHILPQRPAPAPIPIPIPIPMPTVPSYVKPDSPKLDNKPVEPPPTVPRRPTTPTGPRAMMKEMNRSLNSSSDPSSGGISMPRNAHSATGSSSFKPVPIITSSSTPSTPINVNSNPSRPSVSPSTPTFTATTPVLASAVPKHMQHHRPPISPSQQRPSSPSPLSQSQQTRPQSPAPPSVPTKPQTHMLPPKPPQETSMLPPKPPQNTVVPPRTVGANPPSTGANGNISVKRPGSPLDKPGPAKVVVRDVQGQSQGIDQGRQGRKENQSQGQGQGQSQSQIVVGKGNAKASSIGTGSGPIRRKSGPSSAPSVPTSQPKLETHPPRVVHSRASSISSSASVPGLSVGAKSSAPSGSRSGSRSGSKISTGGWASPLGHLMGFTPVTGQSQKKKEKKVDMDGEMDMDIDSDNENPPPSADGIGATLARSLLDFHPLGHLLHLPSTAPPTPTTPSPRSPSLSTRIMTNTTSSGKGG